MSVLWNFFGVNGTDKTQAICNLSNGTICKKFQHDNDVNDRISELRHYADLTNCSKCKISSDPISEEPGSVCPEYIQKHKLEFSMGLKLQPDPSQPDILALGMLLDPGSSLAWLTVAALTFTPPPLKALLIWRIRLHPVLTYFSFLPLIFLLHPSLSKAYFFLTRLLT